MRLIILVAVLLATFSARADDLVILGRLKAIDADVPACGIFFSSAIAEFEVVKVIAGQYSQDRIYVVHPCPEMNVKLVVGEIYRFTVGEENTEHVEMIGGFHSKVLPKGYRPYFEKNAVTLVK